MQGLSVDDGKGNVVMSSDVLASGLVHLKFFNIQEDLNCFVRVE